MVSSSVSCLHQPQWVKMRQNYNIKKNALDFGSLSMKISASQSDPRAVVLLLWMMHVGKRGHDIRTSH